MNQNHLIHATKASGGRVVFNLRNVSATDATSLGSRREAVRARLGLGGLSLIEMHEEMNWQTFKGEEARRDGKPWPAMKHLMTAENLDTMICHRIACQGIAWENENPRLRFGVPDAERSYRRAR